MLHAGPGPPSTNTQSQLNRTTQELNLSTSWHLWEWKRVKANVKDNFQGQRLIIWGQGQDQGLETQDQGHGQLASRILEDSISDVHKKHTAYTVHLVHHLILDKTFSDWRIGGSQDPPPLATPMLLYIYSVDDWTDTMLIGHRDTVRAWRLSIIKLQLV